MNIFNIFNSKKRGQSLVEYAIILGMVIVTSFTAASELYDAARHNFYYGLLPTNNQNIELPLGPNGEKGWFNEDYLGVPKIECSANEIVPPTIEYDDEGREIKVYEVEQDQEIYCTDVSENSVRNNWGAKYKNTVIGSNEDKKLELSVWDEFGIKHTTYVILRPLSRTVNGQVEKPIAVITTQPASDYKTFLENDVINVSGTSSTPLAGGIIDAYEWEIVDVGYEDNKRTTRTYTLYTGVSNTLISPSPSYKNIAFTVIGDEQYNLDERQEFNQSHSTAGFLGSSPTGTRYVRLRVHSTAGSKSEWSDWTQEAIKTGESKKPRAVISTYSGVNQNYIDTYDDNVVSLRTAESIFMTYVYSINPNTENDKININLENGHSAYVNRGIISYKWFISKLNNETGEFENEQALGEKVSISMNDTNYTKHIEDNPDSSTHVYGFTFKDVGAYCVRLAVQNDEGNWSMEGECTPDYTVPDSPNNRSVKYFIVRKGNIAPTVTIESSPPMVDGQIKGTISTDFIFKPNVVHPEMFDGDDWQMWYEPSDYTFGGYEWKVTDEDDNELSSGSGTVLEDIVVDRFGASGTYKVQIRVKDLTGLESTWITFPISVIFPTNYGAPKVEYYDAEELPVIPSGQGTLVNIASDDVTKEINMGFSFLAYGIEFSHVEFSSNGLLTFTQGKRWNGGSWGNSERISTGTNSCGAQPMNNSNTPQYSLAAYWTDLWPFYGNYASTYVKYFIDNDRVIIEYKNHSHYNIKSTSSVISFTIVIYSSGYIDVYYPDVDFSMGDSSYYGWGKGSGTGQLQSTTIGLKGSHSQISQLSHSPNTKVIQNGQVMRFTPIE